MRLLLFALGVAAPRRKKKGNRSAGQNSLKVFYWDRSGPVVWAKRLEAGSFADEMNDLLGVSNLPRNGRRKQRAQRA